MKIDKEEFYKYLESVIGIQNIGDDTLFFENIGMDGFDAELFMMNLAEKYDVNLELYDPYVYHPADSEVGNFFLAIYWRIFKKSRLKKESFSALHLYSVVANGSWFYPQTYE